MLSEGVAHRTGVLARRPGLLTVHLAVPRRATPDALTHPDARGGVVLDEREHVVIGDLLQDYGGQAAHAALPRARGFAVTDEVLLSRPAQTP